MLNPDAQASRNIVLNWERKRTLLEMLTLLTPRGDREVWDNLAAALRHDVGT